MTRPLTRRELLERATLGGAVLTIPGFLAACGGGGIEGSGTTTAATAGGAKTLADKLVMSNWTLYIDIDEKTKTYPTLEQFTEQTGSTSSTSRTSTTTTSGSARTRPPSRRSSQSGATSPCSPTGWRAGWSASGTRRSSTRA